jgi:hypothetical protein
VGPPGTTPMGPAEVAGVKPASHWNSATGNRGALTPLLLASGATIAATVTWGSPSANAADPGSYRVGYVDMMGDTRMMNGYLDPLSADAPATAVVTDLPAAIAASGYDVYVYYAGNIGVPLTRTYNYTIGSTTVSVLQVGPSATTFAGFRLAANQGAGNYVIFRRVTGRSFTLTALPGVTTSDAQRAPLNGFQIVWPAEP